MTLFMLTHLNNKVFPIHVCPSAAAELQWGAAAPWLEGFSHPLAVHQPLHIAVLWRQLHALHCTALPLSQAAPTPSLSHLFPPQAEGVLFCVSIFRSGGAVG